jgi:ribosomal protein S21
MSIKERGAGKADVHLSRPQVKLIVQALEELRWAQFESAVEVNNDQFQRIFKRKMQKTDKLEDQFRAVKFPKKPKPGRSRKAKKAKKARKGRR